MVGWENDEEGKPGVIGRGSYMLNEQALQRTTHDNEEVDG